MVKKSPSSPDTHHREGYAQGGQNGSGNICDDRTISTPSGHRFSISRVPSGRDFQEKGDQIVSANSDIIRQSLQNREDKLATEKLQKTELNLRQRLYHEIFKSEISINMDDDSEEPEPHPVSRQNSTEKETPVSTDNINININRVLNSRMEKQPLSRTTTQSRSSESDQIAYDFCDDETDTVSSRSSTDDDPSDFSSDYNTEKSTERSEKHRSSRSSSRSPEFLKISDISREIGSLETSPVIVMQQQQQRYESPNNIGHENLGFIAEESEPEDGDANTISSSSSRNGNGGPPPIDQRSPLQQQRSASVVSASFADGLSSDNLQRVIIRDFRKQIVRSADHKDGICLDTFVNLCKKQDLLKKLFDLFDRRQEKQLNQHEWIEFLKIRLIGTGQHRDDRRVDFVELVESVTYAICQDANVDFDKFRLIFGDKNVLTKFFRLIDRDGDGVVTAEQIMEFIAQFNSARSGSRLTKENISVLEKLFRENVGDGNEIRKEDFKRIIKTKNEFFVDRVFDIFDVDGSGAISMHEFLDAMHQFAGQDADDKIRFLFKVYDVDGDGVIRCEELGKVIRACLAENGMKFSDDQTDELTTALFEDADVEGQGALTFDALKAQLKKHPGLLENMSIMLDQWLVPPEQPKRGPTFVAWIKSMKPHHLSIKYIKNNYVYLFWRLVFIIVNIGLFTARCITFRDKGTYIMLARGAGQCLNFNCTFIVVVMLRQCLTFLRSRGASKLLPIDQHIKLHKMTGQLIFFFAALHTVMHLINISEGLMPNNEINFGNWSYMDFLFKPETSNHDPVAFGLIPGYAFNSGVILMIVLTVMVVGSMPFVRRGGCFEVFYWTHLLYYVFWALLIIHGPNFWKWFLVPGVIFLIEQTLRYFNWRVGRGRTCVSSGILLPSKVTHLVIRRPPNFDFQSGDYVFVRIPKIAKSEWHPFTISSAPEQEEAIWLHIRACGEWTSRLFEYFEKEQEKLKYYSDGRTKRTTKFSVKSKPPREEPIIVQALELVQTSEKPTDYRKRLPTVGVCDSQESVEPESSNSGGEGTNNEPFSSEETVNDCDVMIRHKNVPIQTRPKPKLTSTKSLPNVHERMKKREIRMQIRNAAPHFQRSLSVNEVENDGNGTKMQTSSVDSVRARRTTASSFKYMRNKPTVIALKTPSYEESNGEMSLTIGNGCEQKLAEEGRLGPSNNREMDPQLEAEGNELHPILGTTNTALAVGRPLEIYLDGPYGAPSSHIFRAEHAVLIATGIGVTPFASILQSIMQRYWASRNTCPNCRHTWCGELPQSVLSLKKVDFFWINRDQRSFEWFVHLLSKLEIEQAESQAMERFLDMHMYITSALQRTDMKAVGLQLALDLLHKKEKRDLITGLKTRTNAGRPNWTKVFQQIAEQRKGKVTVFYCGPPALARTLKFKCDEFGFTFRKEIF